MDAVSLAKVKKLQGITPKNTFQKNFIETMTEMVEKNYNLRGKQEYYLNDIYQQHFPDDAVDNVDVSYPNGISVSNVGAEYGLFYDGAKIGTPQTTKEDADYLAQWLSAAMPEILDIHDKVKTVKDKFDGEVVNDPDLDFPPEDIDEEEDAF